MKALIQKAADECTAGNVRALAKLICTPERTVRQWQSSGKMPGAAEILLRLLADESGSLRNQLLKRIPVNGEAGLR
jgi:hypothetical protein